MLCPLSYAVQRMKEKEGEAVKIIGAEKKMQMHVGFPCCGEQCKWWYACSNIKKMVDALIKIGEAVGR